MVVRELRIGNYIETDHGYAEVTAIYVDGPDSVRVCPKEGKEEEINIQDAKPIGLSHDLLTGCCGYDPNGRFRIGLDHHRYFLRMKDGYMMLVNRQNDILIHFWDVKYLHQLQNLFYALTGHEMEISLSQQG